MHSHLLPHLAACSFSFLLNCSLLQQVQLLCRDSHTGCTPSGSIPAPLWVVQGLQSLGCPLLALLWCHPPTAGSCGEGCQQHPPPARPPGSPLATNLLFTLSHGFSRVSVWVCGPSQLPLFLHYLWAAAAPPHAPTLKFWQARGCFHLAQRCPEAAVPVAAQLAACAPTQGTPAAHQHQNTADPSANFDILRCLR